MDLKMGNPKRLANLSKHFVYVPYGLY